MKQNSENSPQGGLYECHSPVCTLLPLHHLSLICLFSLSLSISLSDILIPLPLSLSLLVSLSLVCLSIRPFPTPLTPTYHTHTHTQSPAVIPDAITNDMLKGDRWDRRHRPLFSLGFSLSNWVWCGGDTALRAAVCVRACVCLCY